MNVLGILQAALARLGPLLKAAGLNPAVVSAALTQAGRAAAAAGPAAPAILAAAYLAKAWTAIKRSSAGIELCRDRAGLWALRQGGPIVHVGTIPTPEWPECWHKGLKTGDRRPGRMSQRIPGTVVRRDVLPRSRGGDQVLAMAVLGRPLGEGELLVIPWLGPWALGRGGVRELDLAGFSPSAYAEAITLAAVYLDRDDLPDADRRLAARVATAAARFAVAGTAPGWPAGQKPTANDIADATALARLAGALALGGRL